MNKKILSIFVLVLTLLFTTQAFASLTFTSDAITGTTASSIDLGASNALSLQATGNGAITTGSGLTTLGGDLNIVGNVGLGIAPSPSMKFYISSTTNASSFFGGYLGTTSAYTGGSGGGLTGLQSSANYSSSTSFGTLKGFVGGVNVQNNSGPKTITSAVGVEGIAYDTGDNTTMTSAVGGNFSVGTGSGMAASVFTEAIGVKTGISAYSGDVSVVNGYGLKILPFTKTGTITGTLGTIYGAYIGDQTGQSFSTDYNLYSAGATSKNVFEGSIKVNSTLNKGTCVLGTSCASITVATGAICTATDTTGIFATRAVVSGTTLTITGNGTDTIAYICL